MPRSILSSSIAPLLVIAIIIGNGWAAVEAHAGDCEPAAPPTFTVTLPKVTNPPDPHGWGGLPLVWGSLNSQIALSDSIEVPNGRPIYALIVSGHSRNGDLDELLVYRFARHLMDEGAYVHWAWWNNLLAPYMERPLHHPSSHPGAGSALDFATENQAVNKAVPGENYQFLSDAKLFLEQIRENNPSAMIILVGHSMGGRSIVDLALQTDVVIDLVAPIDPVANRTYPWSTYLPSHHHFNWTRWRATRASFAGYKSMAWQGVGKGCAASGPWRKHYDDAASDSDLACIGENKVFIHNPPELTFGSNVINLHHRWQGEHKFPFDNDANYHFKHSKPAGGTTSQSKLAMQGWDCGLFGIDPCPEPDGWPDLVFPAKFQCCPPSDGITWKDDGHGEIIGNRGPFPNLVPLGTRVKTSPNCGSNCSGLNWPIYTGSWSSSNNAARKAKLKELEDPDGDFPWDPNNDNWPNRPYNASLCKVSTGLIGKFNNMNEPPTADAGGDQVITCNGCSSALVTLDGSASFDPDGFALTYTWTGPFGTASGEVVNVSLPVGWHCVTLTVKDSAGHIARSYATIHVSDLDAQTPVETYLSAAGLWKKHAGAFVARAFDEFFPGASGSGGCLLNDPLQPITINLSGGSITVAAHENSTPYCAITDSGSGAAHSDARLNNASSIVTFDFDPPITGFYTYYGSLAIGHTATMALYSAADGSHVAALTTLPSTHNVLSAGQGFTSAVPIERVEFSATEPGSVMVGAFTGLLSGEPSLGTVNIPGYAGPAGNSVQLDFAVSFVNTCPADLSGSDSVGVADLLVLLAAWGPCPSPGTCPADLTDDGSVGVADLLALLAAWGPCP